MAVGDYAQTLRDYVDSQSSPDFLHSLSAYLGKDQAKAIGEHGQGYLSLLDPRLANVGGGTHPGPHASAAFAQLLAKELQPGGVLSGLQTNQTFIGQMRDILAGERSRTQEGVRALQQTGVSPQLAAAVYGEQPYRALQALSPVRAQAETGLREDRFNAYNQLIEYIRSDEQLQTQAALARAGLRANDKAAGLQAISTAVGTGVAAAGAFA